jgi:hypothetical protein
MTLSFFFNASTTGKPFGGGTICGVGVGHAPSYSIASATKFVSFPMVLMVTA